MNVFMLKNYFCCRYQKANVYVRVKSYFFHKLLFGSNNMVALKRSTHIDHSCCGGIIT